MQKLSWIHFYQTRKAEQAEVCDAEEINLQVFKLVNWMKDDLSRSKRDKFLSQETLEKSAVPEATLREHGLQETVEVLHQNKAWNINSFHELGWLDGLDALADRLPEQSLARLNELKRNHLQACEHRVNVG